MGSAGERISGKQIPQKPIFSQQISENVTQELQSLLRGTAQVALVLY